MSTTTLSLYDATGILTDLISSQSDVTKCSVCHEKLTSDSYSICKFPEPPPGTRGVPLVHEGHTACKKCVDDLAYIGDGAACLPCLKALGGRRSSIKLAGVALRPAIRNTLANQMLACFEQAEHSIQYANDQTETARIQEGASRRAAAVDDVRRRRQEAEEAASAEAEETKRRAREEAEDMMVRAHEEVERARATAREEVEETKRRAVEEVAERVRIEEETRREEQALTAVSVTTAVRKRKAMDPDIVKARTEAAKKTREAKKAKLEHYDTLVDENNVLQAKLSSLLSVSRHHLLDAGLDLTSFENEVDAAWNDLNDNGGISELDGEVVTEDEEEDKDEEDKDEEDVAIRAD